MKEFTKTIVGLDVHKETVVTGVLPGWSAKVVDFLIGDRIAIEVKAKANVGPHDLRSLHAIKEEGAFRRFICVSLEPHPRQVDGIEILPVAHFLKALWSGDFS